ncbi:MAG TPA: glutathione ABC transporter substrate-binding protein [Candidatus Jeotgalicoccus stercoravium]|nr:glutathione ABC transporter substrate-binding protein [Candidatus Jeotgalicoccus stercoravium]
MKLFKISIFILGLVFLSACTDDSAISSETEASEGEEGGDLVVSYPSDAGSLDPAGVNDMASDQRRQVIYEGLISLDDNLEPKALLAEDFKQVDDTTWHFTLKEGVKFHDGSSLTADAVKASIDRIKDPAMASSRAYIFDMIDEVNVIDDYTVEIKTGDTFAPLLSYLSHDGAGIISKQVIDEDYQNALNEAEIDMSLEEFYALREEGGEKYTDIAKKVSEYTGTIVEKKPTGTGYMKFQSRSPGEKVVVERFDEYWDGPVNLDTVTFKIVTEDASRIAELESGQSQLIQGFDVGQVERLESNPNINVLPVYNISTEFVGMNTQKGPLKDKRVRQAIGHLIDKDSIMEGIYLNMGRTMKGAIQEEVLGYDENLEDLEYNPSKAKTLLKEAGYEDGFDLKLLTNDVPDRVDIAVYLQEELKTVDINIEIEQLEWGTYLEAVSSGEQDLFILGWPNTVGDPDQGLWPILHSSMLGNGGNRFFFENEAVDQLLEEGRRELDSNKRAEIYQEINEILVEEQPAVFVKQAEYPNAMTANVHGLEIDQFGHPDFRKVTLD